MTESRDRLADALADRYLLEEALGRGATATVYLAQDVRHGRRVALKVLHAALGQGHAPGSSRIRHPDGNHALTVTRRLVH